MSIQQVKIEVLKGLCKINKKKLKNRKLRRKKNINSIHFLPLKDLWTISINKKLEDSIKGIKPQKSSSLNGWVIKREGGGGGKGPNH